MGTYTAGVSERSIDIKKADGISNWTLIQRRVRSCLFGHTVGWELSERMGFGRTDLRLIR